MLGERAVSHPSRVCGLKYNNSAYMHINEVAPFAGVWIEIDANDPDAYYDGVAPFAGVWIEI